VTADRKSRKSARDGCPNRTAGVCGPKASGTAKIESRQTQASSHRARQNNDFEGVPQDDGIKARPTRSDNERKCTTYQSVFDRSASVKPESRHHISGQPASPTRDPIC